MLPLPFSIGIYLFTAPVDMRKGAYSLARLVADHQQNVFSGPLFVSYHLKEDEFSPGR